ncbi:MAG: UDP-N-acetylglucosamine 2-epimerase (non-hydrolyzing) [Acidobacteria bacterium]|nr:UDP-N-acetylglucosamine 2-epimerase (non-hydrolyzing) [Acidobacteriota bacterium]
MSLKVTIVAGARPNFMKVGPIISAFRKLKNEGSHIDCRLVHTGQHSGSQMSDTFFEQLGIPEPDVNLGVSGGSHAKQTAEIMVAFEADLEQNPTDLVIVVGDINSTMATAIVAKKLGVPVAHVEGGLRSGDMSMPEEINRKVTDSIADFFFTTSRTAGENLLSEGIDAGWIFFVGNTMIDSLLENLNRLEKPPVWDELDLRSGGYLLLTLHRPANVDSVETLSAMLRMIGHAASSKRVIFPVHPRTRKTLEHIPALEPNIIPIEPMGYLEFIYLLKHARGIITDSGGITEEATVLGVPCLTARTTTERPETVEVGTNTLLGDDLESIPDHVERMVSGNWRKGAIPELWDGKAAERIVEEIVGLWEARKIGAGQKDAKSA